MAKKINPLPLLFDIPKQPDFSGEQRLMRHGAKFVAGTDEAGRGPLAGPVVAAAVILDPDNIPVGLNDSKKLSHKQREKLYQQILDSAFSVSICSMSALSIDLSDIRKASLEAMRRACQGLAVQPDYILIDGRDIPDGLPCAADSWVKGDQRSVSIAAASIIAKEMRDKMMILAASQHPHYGFEKHAGYATVTHRQAIEGHGPVKKLHRYSFAPIKNMDIK